MSLEKQINEEMKAAMLAKNTVELRGLRAIKAAVLLAKTEKGGGNGLDETAEARILAKLLKQRKDSLAIYEEQGRDDLAQKELEEIAVIERFMPKMMDEADVAALVQQVVSETGASGMKDMGKVMGISVKRAAGKADGKLISELVKKALQG